MIRRLRRLYAPLAAMVLAGLAIGVAPPGTAQQPSAGAPDLAAMTLSPFDPGLSEFTHAGAFDEALVDEARQAAAYRGNPADEETFVALLEAAGFVRKHVVNLERASETDPAQLEEVVRSYVTVYRTAEGARTAFAALEDESLVFSAEDLPVTTPLGEEVDLTADGGFDNMSRPFRSLDLTFRLGNLIGGVALVVYPSAAGFEPDPAEVEALGAVLAERLADPPAPSIGVSVARLDPAEVVTLDDAYYRLDDRDLPLTGESAETSALRTGAYGEAETVYQLFQGIDGSGTVNGIYSVTIYAFATDRAASDWMDDSAELIAANDYYANLASADPEPLPGDHVLAFTFGPFGAPPKARIVLVQTGVTVVRVQIVPSGAMPAVPAPLLAELAAAQLSCLELGDCISVPIPQALTAYVETAVVVPSASPVPSPANTG
jgi:hypothetical protein